MGTHYDVTQSSGDIHCYHLQGGRHIFIWPHVLCVW